MCCLRQGFSKQSVETCHNTKILLFFLTFFLSPTINEGVNVNLTANFRALNLTYQRQKTCENTNCAGVEQIKSMMVSTSTDMQIPWQECEKQKIVFWGGGLQNVLRLKLYPSPAPVDKKTWFLFPLAEFRRAGMCRAWANLHLRYLHHS